MFVEIRKDVLRADHPSPLPIVLRSIGSSMDQESIQRPEGSNYHHLIWVTEGRGRFWVEEKKMILEAGEGLFCRRKIPHGYAPENIFRTEWMTFTGADSLLDYCGVGNYLQFRMSPSVAASAAQLRTVCEGSSTVISRSAATYQWLTEFLAELMAPYKQPEQIVREYLEVHYNKPLTLEEIAQQVHMSKYGLCHYYAQNVGTTVLRELQEIRVAKAKQLLRFTDRPVAEIGNLCGYDSASYFGKRFKEIAGCTPGDYRIQRKK